ncbi:hypothetical protein B7R22_16950 [Subtercola boreus]|uniref:Uncharacterized protein n=1 Tax=Subtercola boreus TaxID=120213 RepID=A0A3E0VR86_9MICO|nr:hypothetical protein [Subtercola boreus]RFA12119.1 hypothetical protein B7R22_16950 [Subtercola boreus]
MGIFAADLNENAIGVDVTLHLGKTPVGGTLNALAWPMGMVGLVIDGMNLGLPREKPIELTAEGLRDWILVESDPELRGRLLDELGRLEAERVGAE